MRVMSRRAGSPTGNLRWLAAWLALVPLARLLPLSLWWWVAIDGIPVAAHESAPGVVAALVACALLATPLALVEWALLRLRIPRCAGWIAASSVATTVGVIAWVLLWPPLVRGLLASPALAAWPTAHVYLLADALATLPYAMAVGLAQSLVLRRAGIAAAAWMPIAIAQALARPAVHAALLALGWSRAASSDSVTYLVAPSLAALLGAAIAGVALALLLADGDARARLGDGVIGFAAIAVLAAILVAGRTTDANAPRTLARVPLGDANVTHAIPLDDGVLLAGTWRGRLALGGAHRDSGEHSAVFAARLDRRGHARWLRRIDGEGVIALGRDAHGIARIATVEGEALVVRALDGSGPTTTDPWATSDGAIASFAGDGTLWAARPLFGDDTNAATTRLTRITSDGARVVRRLDALGALRVHSLVPTGDGCLIAGTTASPGARHVLVRVDGDGEIRWQRRFGDDRMALLGATLDEHGAVAIVGTAIAGPLDLGGAHPIEHPGGGRRFVAAYTADGALAWVRFVGDGGWRPRVTLLADGRGGFVLVDDASGALMVDGNAIAPLRSGTDVLAVHLDARGAQAGWVTVGDEGEDLLIDARHDARGRLVLATLHTGTSAGSDLPAVRPERELTVAAVTFAAR